MVRKKYIENKFGMYLENRVDVRQVVQVSRIMNFLCVILIIFICLKIMVRFSVIKIKIENNVKLVNFCMVKIDVNFVVVQLVNILVFGNYVFKLGGEKWVVCCCIIVDCFIGNFQGMDWV